MAIAEEPIVLAPPEEGRIPVVHRTCAPGEAFCRAYSWMSEGTVRGQVLLVHGLGEHAGRHRALIAALAGAGYGVHAYDYYGHGHSPGPRGYIRRFEEVLDDFVAFREWAKGRTDGAPCFLLGHSLGGLILAAQAQRAPLEARGVVFSSPFLAVPGRISPVLVALSRWLSALTPWLIVHGQTPALISRDSEEVRRYSEDPLVHRGGVRARTAAEIHRTLRALDHGHLTDPMLVLHGENDHIAPLEGSQRLYEEAPAASKQLEVYPGAYHELFHDICAEEVTRTLLDWLDAQG